MNTAPKPTSEKVKMSNRKYIRWTDGSLRRAIQKPKGKAAVKAAKRARRSR